MGSDRLLSGESRTVQSPLGQLFLGRLERLVGLEVPANRDFDAERLRHWALYSTYADCVKLGVRAEAHEILARCRAMKAP